MRHSEYGRREVRFNRDQVWKVKEWARGALVGSLAMVAVSCGSNDPVVTRRSAATVYGGDSTGARPTSDVKVPMHARKELVENSAAAVSNEQPGIVFTINDSGNDPMLFAFDTTGADRGAWVVDSANNVDWEAAAEGPCASSARGQRAEPNGRRCIYIGDTGDNSAVRPVVVIYRVLEPRAAASSIGGGHLKSDRLVFRYPDGSHDVEAMYVAPDGAVILISKRPLYDEDGHMRPALVFRLAASAWNAGTVVTADLVDSLPIVPGTAPWRTITDAALSPDDRYLAVRTYAQVYVFETDSATGRRRSGVRPAVCNIYHADDDAGEGIGWVGGGTSRRLVLTSEGRRSPLRIVTCPLPGGAASGRR